MRVGRALLCLAVLIILMPCGAFARDEEDALLPPLWCAPTQTLLADLARQNFVSKKRDQLQDSKTYEWFATPREIIVLQHNQDGISCIAAEGPAPAKAMQ
jgi:hypothetical protein